MTTTAVGARRPRRPSPLWKALRAILFVALIAAAVAIGLGIGRFLSPESRMSDSQIVQSVQRQEKVALVALAVQGIAREDTDGKIMGVTVPAGDRTTLLQYAFTAQLGIDGEKVDVTSTDPDGTAFLVTIPDFIFIGYDDLHFEDPIQSNGALSFLTEEIEVTRMINDILDEEDQQTYIEQHAAVLRSQAEAYYTAIIKSVNADAEVSFAFTR